MKYLLIALFLAPFTAAEDWPEFRGPRRNGISTEKLNARNLKVLWRAQVGKGHSAISVADDRAYTLGWNGQSDTVFCLDIATGKPLWTKSYPCKTIVQWPGPRATPTVRDGVVHTLGQWGQMHAWSARDGAKVWSITLDKSYNPDDDYGFAWSPLIAGENLILGTGSRGLAIRRKDGSFAWGDDAKPGACASAVPFDHAGKPAFAMLAMGQNRDWVHIIGVDAASGRELWRSSPWRERWGAACVDVLIDSNQVFITTSEQFKKSGRFTITGEKLREDWTTNAFAGYTGACVLLDGQVYGVSQSGKLTCIDWNTGQIKWSQRGFDEHGSLMAADGKLIVQCGKSGDLVIASASPDKYAEIARLKVFEGDGKCFTAPALANGRIYCRSYAGEVVCIEIK